MDAARTAKSFKTFGAAAFALSLLMMKAAPAASADSKEALNWSDPASSSAVGDSQTEDDGVGFLKNKATEASGLIRGVLYVGTDTNNRISGATVKANGATVTTSSSGAWSFSVPAGAYTVTASASGYNSGSTQCVLDSGTSEKWCSFGLTPASAAPTTGAISGTLTDASSGAAISGASVSAGGATTTSTSSTGAFSFTLAAGTYTLTGTASGYDTGTKNCSVTAGGFSSCSFSLTRRSTKGSLQGVVYQNGNKSDLVAPATISVSGVGSAVYSGSAMWTFSVEPGTYAVTASASGYDPATQTCQVTTGQATDCSIELARTQPGGGGNGNENGGGESGGTTPIQTTGIIQGIVYQNGNLADTVAPATVTLNGIGSTVYRGTEPWSFTVEAGTYIVEVTAAGYRSSSMACMAVGGATENCNVELFPSDSSGDPEGGPEAPYVPDAGQASGGTDTDMDQLDGATLSMESGCASGGSSAGGWLWLTAWLPMLGRRRRAR